jgi:excisionase family DNA binding protein
MDDSGEPDQLLTASEVARVLRVNPRTVRRWEANGKLRCIRTLGVHRRFRRSDIERAIANLSYDI